MKSFLCWFLLFTTILVSLRSVHPLSRPDHHPHYHHYHHHQLPEFKYFHHYFDLHSPFLPPQDVLFADDIVPEIVDIAPTKELQVLYNQNGSLAAAMMGNELLPDVVKDKPIFYWTADCSVLFTLIMIDPDAPSRKDPKSSQVVHFMVGNIPGHQVHTGDLIVDYLGAYPPKDTGLHRYIVLLYQQIHRINFRELIIPSMNLEKRMHFSVRRFAEKYQLFGPVAINYFQAQYNDFVADFYSKQNGTAPTSTSTENPDAELVTSSKEPK